MPNLFEELRILVSALGAGRDPCAIRGRIAMAVHAHPRATIDIDLLAPAAAGASIADALLPLPGAPD